ncbi:hypothetical protein CUJ87_20045 [Paraburkholderia caledonica]|nr:hypothetical protein CUJ87_20045 [Paraburkholderia caledonica]
MAKRGKQIFIGAVGEIGVVQGGASGDRCCGGAAIGMAVSTARSACQHAAQAARAFSAGENISNRVSSRGPAGNERRD